MADEARDIFKHPVEVELTDDEINARLNRNAEIDRKILEIQAEKAAANSGFNGDLKTLRKEQVTLLESAKAGTAKLEIDCYQERDDRRGIMLTMRCDNGNIVDERALTAEERGTTPEDRQGNLFEETVGSLAAATSDDEPEERGDEDTEKALEEYAAHNAASDNTDALNASADSDDEDESDMDDDSEGAPAH